jgi:hypothetical protein
MTPAPASHRCARCAKQMFVNDTKYAAGFKKFFNDDFGFKRHLALLVCDGSAQSHHCGTSGHSSTYGCNHCELMPCVHVCLRACVRVRAI